MAKQRQALPWVKIDKDYGFDTDDRDASLADLFRGRSQLIVYHFMFGPDFKAGCPSCSAIADEFNGFWKHLAQHDVMFWAISRAQLNKLEAYKRRMEWSFPWASSFRSDFNSDYAVGVTEEQQSATGYDYNFRVQRTVTDPGRGCPTAPIHGRNRYGTNTRTFMRKLPGMSSFVRDGGEVFPHLLGLCARARRAVGHVSMARPRPARPQRGGRGLWWKRRDEYGAL